MGDVQQKMARGIVWMVAARLMDRSIGVISTLILARLLVPGDFGLVAMATAIGGVLDLLGAFSFELALIQNQRAGRAEYDTVWTFNVLFGVFCGLALVGLAWPAAAFYHEPRLAAVMCALALAYLAGGLANVGVVNFRKELNFRDEFKLIFLRRVVTFVATIGGALWFQSYWALVAGIIVGRVVGVIASFQMSDYRPRLSLAAARELFHFSKWLFLNNTFQFLQTNGCNFIIAKLYGATGVGIFSVAYEISNLPSTELVAPINRATFPGFSKMENAEAISASYLQLMGMIGLLILPVGLGIAAVAGPLVEALLGAKWIDAVPLIQLLAIYGAITATQTNNSVVWMVMGRTREVTAMTALFLLILGPSLYFFLGRYGIIGAGYAYLISHAPTVPVAMQMTKRMLGFRWSALISVLWRPLVAVSAMYFCVRAFDMALPHYGAWGRLLIESALGALLYIGLALGLWQLAGKPAGAESFCLNKLMAHRLLQRAKG
ncbi:lipopolysaccharide biosynthesis protein [Chitinimonas naiadis]